jgi:hypothetical protein
LILDKSKGLVLGAELVSNPLSGRATGGGTWVFSAGTVSGVNTHMGFAITASVSVGKQCKISFTASNISGGTCYVNFGTGSAANKEIGSNGNYTFIGTAKNDNEVIFVPYAGTNGTLTLSNVTIKEIAGNHATQATAASCPVLANNAQTKPYRNFDAVDDSMSTTFQSSLGSACTVGRSDPTTGAVILTAQTIGTSYSATADDCQLVIVNRALTGQETTDLTAYLNGKAGL